MEPSLKVTVNGMEFDNPFLTASGPPGTNARVIAKSFELGWGGNVCKTVSLDASKVINTAPRYGKLYDPDHPEVVVGFENIELISDRPFAVWLEEFRDLKRRYPDKILIASIMEEYRRAAWQEIVERVQETGIDGFEMNLSCPHGLPERQMGQFMGEQPDIVREVVGWVTEVATVPVWAKMTPNVADVAAAPRAAVDAGASGISAINTILAIIGVNLKTLRPMPTVEGHTVPGGYSGQAVKPIALRHVMEIARAVPGTPLSGMGGIQSGYDAAEFILLGCSTVQVCTGAMLHGYEIVSRLKEELLEVMREHDLATLDAMRGQALPYFTTHAELVERQKAAKAAKVGSGLDEETWQGRIKHETDALTSD